MAARDIEIVFSEEVKKFIAQKGYDSQYGARPLKRAIQNTILDGLAQEIISHIIGAGDHVIAGIRDGAIVFTKKINRQKPVKERRAIAIK